MPALPRLANARRAYSSPDRIIDAIRQALVVLDEKLRVISANRAFYRAFAVMPEETIGQHLTDVGDHRSGCAGAPRLRSICSKPTTPP